MRRHGTAYGKADKQWMKDAFLHVDQRVPIPLISQGMLPRSRS